MNLFQMTVIAPQVPQDSPVPSAALTPSVTTSLSKATPPVSHMSIFSLLSDS